MEKMKAAIYYGAGDVRIEKVERPRARAEGVVLKVRACGICDIMDLDQWKRGPSGKVPPYRFGHEYAGEVVEVGSKVTMYQVGDRVAAFPIFSPCYKCESCLIGDYWRCINWTRGIQYWAFAEYLEIPFVTSASSVKVPDTLSFHDLTFIEPLQLAAGVGEKGKAGDTVVVQGQDLLGLGIVVKLKEREAKVISSDISKKRIDASREIGADVVIDAINEDVVQVVMKETSGEGADVVIVNDPRPAGLSQAISAVKRGGTIWLVMYHSPFKFASSLPPMIDLWTSPAAHYVEPPVAFNPVLLNMQCCYGTFTESRVSRFLQAVELVKSRKITAEKYVTHVFPLDKIKEALEVASNPHECIKVVVEP
jgi:L-iditol 2-dehydrogenase